MAALKHCPLYNLRRNNLIPSDQLLLPVTCTFTTRRWDNMSADSCWATTENDGSSATARGGRTRATGWQSQSSAGNRGRNVGDRSGNWRSPDHSTRGRSGSQNRRDYAGSRQQQLPSYRREGPGMRHSLPVLDVTLFCLTSLSCRYGENFPTNEYVKHIGRSWRNAEKYKELGCRTS
jgi:hypothetical protein